MNKNIHIKKIRNAGMEAVDYLKPPSYLIEFAYLGLLVYTMVVGPASGLMIPLVGAGTLAVLVVLCLMHFGSHSVEAFQPIKLALKCAVSVLILQLFVFEESLLAAGLMRSFLTWVLGLIVIQSLSFRKGFLHRFAFVAFLIGCGTLPFMKVYVATEEMVRVGGEGMPLGNPNFFGMWFGFCTIYFIVTGVEAKNYLIRTASWSAGVLCMYLVAITVSRGALLGVAIATVIAFEKMLKRSFLPVLGLLFLAWLVYESGVFGDLIGYYVHRGAEESGRSNLWAWAFTGFLDAWWVGVGLSNSLITKGNDTFGPHNSFLFIALSSGILPLAFYIAYIVQVIRGALRARTQNTPDSPYKLPLVSFAILALMVADGTFMSPWHMIVFSAAMATGNVNRKRKKQIDKTLTGNFTKRELAKKFPSSSLRALRKK